MTFVIIRKVLSELPIVERVVEWVKMKETSALLSKNKHSRMKRRVQVPKLDDANLAGTGDSPQCTLILTEGDRYERVSILVL